MYTLHGDDIHDDTQGQLTPRVKDMISRMLKIRSNQKLRHDHLVAG